MTEQVARNTHLRPLLPARHPRAEPASDAAPTRTRSKLVAAACLTCRKQKAKCSGERPSCRRCRTHQLQCEWTTQPGETQSQAVSRQRQRQLARGASLQELFDVLKRLPEKDAQDVFRRIRAGTDIETILSHVKIGDLLCQMAVVPETRFRYTLPFRTAIPMEDRQGNPYLDSFIYEGVSVLGDSQEAVTTATTGEPSMSDKFKASNQQSLYLRPFHAAEALDPELFDAKISTWTTVFDDDVLMRELLSSFFRCEYQFSAIFQKDLFLDDLANARHDFCSSLLVNALLGYSCVCYSRFTNRAEYWNPHTLLYRFTAEAKRLWELEASKPRITTIHAGILLHIIYNFCGLDEIGQAYRIQATALAYRLRLYSAETEQTNDRIERGWAFTAWALYAWDSLVGFSFCSVPLLETPPSPLLPDPMKNSQWYGEVMLQYPLVNHLLPTNFGHVFKARCEFRVIMNTYCRMAYSTGPPMSLSGAQKLHSSLRAWYDELPACLSPKAIVLPHHLQLHIYYHNLILAIFGRLVNTPSGHELTQVVADSKKCIRTLVRLYYLRHGFDAMDLFIVIPLILLALDCIDAIDEQPLAENLESLQSTLILAAQGLHSQRRNHYLAEALFRVVRGRMRPTEVALLKRTVDVSEEHASDKEQMLQNVRSHWPVSVVKGREDLDSKVLNRLVETYAHLNIKESLPTSTDYAMSGSEESHGSQETSSSTAR